MIKPIIKDMKALRVPCVTVLEGEDIKDLIYDLRDTCLAHHGVGLAANQIAVNKQVAILMIPDIKTSTKGNIKYKEYILVNPILLEKSNRITIDEECLSFPGLILKTDRYLFCIVQNGKKVLSFSGLESVAVQHEISHLKGQLFFDFKHKDVNRRR